MMLLKQLTNIIKIVSQGGGLKGKKRRGGASLGEGRQNNFKERQSFPNSIKG